MAKKAEADVDVAVAAPDGAALNGAHPKNQIKGYMSVFPGETQELPEQITQLLLKNKNVIRRQATLVINT